jgi:enoyl-CoA hydratase
MTDLAQQVLVQIDEAIATVTLNRPERRNALTAKVITGLSDAIAALNADPSVAVIVLTGTDPAFCAGLDLAELSGSGDNLKLDASSRPWTKTAKPVICAVNGAAVTGGLELVLNCDFVIASDRARFADTHARVGVLPGWGMTVLLPQAVGLRRAKEMSLTGNYVVADLALQWGLVNHVVAHDDLMNVAWQCARDIASADRAAVAALNALYTEHEAAMVDVPLVRELDAARAWAARMFSPDRVGARTSDLQERGRTQVNGG